MSNVLKGWLADKAVATDNKDDKILELESEGNLTEKEILDRMLKEIIGLKAVALHHAMSLYNRIVMESLLNGYTVNTGLLTGPNTLRITTRFSSGANSLKNTSQFGYLV